MLEDSIRRMERQSAEDGGPEGIDVTTDRGARLAADQALLAFGRTPNTGNIDLDRVGVATGTGGSIIVEEDSRTSAPHICAVGDVSNRFNLTPVAVRDGHALADSVFGKRRWRVDCANIPTALFSSPEVGVVGLTELEARAKHPVVKVYKTRSRPLRATVAGHCETALLKLVVDGETQRILAVHLFADDASEMAQLRAIALGLGARVEDLVSVMALHPTIGEELVAMRTPSMRYDRR